MFMNQKTTMDMRSQDSIRHSRFTNASFFTDITEMNYLGYTEDQEHIIRKLVISWSFDPFTKEWTYRVGKKSLIPELEAFMEKSVAEIAAELKKRHAESFEEREAFYNNIHQLLQRESLEIKPVSVEVRGEGERQRIAVNTVSEDGKFSMTFTASIEKEFMYLYIEEIKGEGSPIGVPHTMAVNASSSYPAITNTFNYLTEKSELRLEYLIH